MKTIRIFIAIGLTIIGIEILRLAMKVDNTKVVLSGVLEYLKKLK